MKTISLDIQKEKLPTLDISGFFRISEVHAIDSGIAKMVIDQIFDNLPEINLHRTTSVRVDDFYTFPTLDIAHSDLVSSLYWRKKYPYLEKAHKTLNLVEDLKIPFGSLDVRRMQSIKSAQKYPDLFKRKLSTSLHIRRISRYSGDFFQKNKQKILYAFCMLLLLCVPLLLFVKISVESAYTKLLSLKNAETISDIKNTIRGAKNDLERAHFIFKPFSWIPGETIDLVNRATLGGQNITRSLDSIVSKIPHSEEKLSLKIINNAENSLYRGNSKDIFFLENMGIPLPTNWLSDNDSVLKNAISEMQSGANIFANISGESSYAKKMRQAGEILLSLTPILQEYQNHSTEILSMLGHKEPQRYIVFNQNRDEIRANGGFPGSIVSFTLYKGNVLDYRTDDVYYYDWNLYPHVEAPPPGIALLTNNYGLRDVNYYPDFRKTLDKANSFVEKSGDSTITTGVAIHQGIIEEILGVVGPVSLDGVDIPFEKDNFSLLMSLLVENKFAKEKTPKDILFSFISAFGKKVVESGKISEVLSVIEDNWRRGEIVFASRNDTINDYLKTLQNPLPWQDNEKNWIYPVYTSISGNKSDRYIKREIYTSIQGIGKCEYNTTVTLKNIHTYTKDDELLLEKYMEKFAIFDEKEQHKMRFIQGRGENKNFVRLYVPQGAELLTQDKNIEITDEDGSTVFSFMLNSPVGQTSEKEISYKQYISDCSSYDNSIKIYRQPGLHHFNTR